MDLTSAHLGLGRDEFVANLTEAKLLPEDELARVAADESADVMKLADDLISAGLITPYQLDALISGRLSDLKLGNYDLLAKLGAGGMGTVFKARHRRMKRVVAIKVLSAHLCTDTAFVSRFQREVETVARLGHPNVVMAYDADEAEMGHFLVMEFVDGRDLASEVEKAGTLSVPRAVDYTIQAARGLAYAHTQGIVHRDVKPHNLLLDRSGVVKLTDLGLARLNSAATAGKGGLTQAGGILGTVDYMAPEQAVDSAAIDARADIYGLGCTLYFLLAGTPPYTGPTLVSVLLKHRDAAVPLLRRVRPDVTAELEAVCARMMAKAVGDRYQTMSEVIAALEPFAPLVSDSPPRAAVAGNAPRPDMSAPPAGGTPPGTVSVLLVEPSRVQSAIIRQYLEAQGMTVCRAVTTGADALAAVQVDHPTSVVASIHLADMSGVELAEQARAATKSDSPAFVLISSEADANEQGVVPRHLNRVTSLAKPFTPNQLVQALNYVTGLSVAVRSSVTVTGLSMVRASNSLVMAAKAKPTRSALRVLLVDDSSTARLHERQVLGGLGFAAFTDAADGAQGIAAATQEKFDLIVTDYNMPLIDGRALVSYLKHHPPTAAVPVLVVTSETDPAVLDPLRAMGVAAILDKGFAAAAVKPVVDQLFGA